MMDYLHTRGGQANKGRLTRAEPYDEDAVRWSAYRAMVRSDDLTTMVRGVQGMTTMVLSERENQVARLREVIELMGKRITALTNENAQLRDSIAALETEHISAPDCEHGLPRDCCAICAELRARGRRIEWTANVRAGGEYQE